MVLRDLPGSELSRWDRRRIKMPYVQDGTLSQIKRSCNFSQYRREAPDISLSPSASPLCRLVYLQPLCVTLIRDLFFVGAASCCSIDCARVCEAARRLDDGALGCRWLKHSCESLFIMSFLFFKSNSRASVARNCSRPVACLFLLNSRVFFSDLLILCSGNYSTHTFSNTITPLPTVLGLLSPRNVVFNSVFLPL